MTETPTAARIDEVDLPWLDVRGDDFAVDPRGALAAALAAGPVARSKRGIEFLSYDLIARSFTDDALDTAGPEHYSRLGAGEQLMKFVDTGLLSTMERSRHDPIRRLMLQAFSFRNVGDQRLLVRATAEEMVDGWSERGSCDLVADFTEHYPIRVLCEMVGIPRADIATFATWAHELHLLAAVPMAPGFPRIEASLSNLETYVRGLLRERTARPQDDFVSSLLAHHLQDAKLTEDELVGNLVNLIFAGMGTTTKQLASAVRDISAHGYWDSLREDDAFVQAAVNESLRFAPVTQFVVRIVQRDAEIDGRLYAAGTRILFNLLAASRDPEKFPDPDRFDPARGADDSRLPFGWGVHRCLGQPLARLLIEEGLRAMTERITEVHADADSAGPHPSEMLGGPTSLPMTFRPRTA